MWCYSQEANQILNSIDPKKYMNKLHYNETLKTKDKGEIMKANRENELLCKDKQ